MIDIKCPGSKYVRQPIPEIFVCPDCEEEVEIWTNERMGKCRSCGGTVVREIDSAYCIQWCQYARECIGVEKYEELLEVGAISEEKEFYIPKRLKKFMKERGISIPGEDSERAGQKG